MLTRFRCQLIKWHKIENSPKGSFGVRTNRSNVWLKPAPVLSSSVVLQADDTFVADVNIDVVDVSSNPSFVEVIFDSKFLAKIKVGRIQKMWYFIVGTKLAHENLNMCFFNWNKIWSKLTGPIKNRYSQLSRGIWNNSTVHSYVIICIFGLKCRQDSFTLYRAVSRCRTLCHAVRIVLLRLFTIFIRPKWPFVSVLR